MLFRILCKVNLGNIDESDKVRMLSTFQIERVNKLNEELQEQVQSTEIQIQAISSQYKVIIQEKEVRFYHRKVAII